MDAYSVIEKRMAEKHGQATTTRKAVGDFMLADNHAVNVKSNNVANRTTHPIKFLHYFKNENIKQRKIILSHFFFKDLFRLLFCFGYFTALRF